MVDLLEDAVRKVRSLSTEMQDEAARVLLAFMGTERPIVQLTPEEEAELAEAEAEIARGDFATEEEVAAVLGKFKL